MLSSFDFSDIRVLADFGGGNGSVLAAILRKYPAMQAILFDRVDVVGRARGELDSPGLSDRVQFVAGDFFESVPSGADAYFLRHIIHDWNDEQALTILKNCRSAMSDSGRLFWRNSSSRKALTVSRKMVRSGDDGRHRWTGTNQRRIRSFAVCERLCLGVLCSSIGRTVHPRRTSSNSLNTVDATIERDLTALRPTLAKGLHLSSPDL
jgi:hypothetical protein